MNEELRLLLSPLYDHDALAPEHLADLYRSTLTDETIRAHKFRSGPPVSIGPLFGFDSPRIRTATLARYPDPADGFHIRVKVLLGSSPAPRRHSRCRRRYHRARRDRKRERNEAQR